MRAEDAQAMRELESVCFPDPWSLRQCRGALSQSNFMAFGIWRIGGLAAYCSFFHYSEEAEIINLAVHPLARRRGLGRRVLLLLLQEWRKMGMRKVALEVRENNQAAISLYEGAGFRMTGLRKKYYPDTGENALIYSLEI